MYAVNEEKCNMIIKYFYLRKSKFATRLIRINTFRD